MKTLNTPIILRVILFSCLLFVSLPETAQACAFCGKYKVTGVEKGDVLHVRGGPSNDEPVIGALPYNGVNIEMGGKCKENGWCTIKFFGVDEAWVNTKYLIRIDGETYKY